MMHRMRLCKIGEVVLRLGWKTASVRNIREERLGTLISNLDGGSQLLGRSPSSWKGGRKNDEISQQNVGLTLEGLATRAVLRGVYLGSRW